MRQPDKIPQAPQGREPGRSFDDPTRPLGDEILKRARQTTSPTEENFQGRARQAAVQSAADRSGVAECAKVVGVLRKAEEFMSTANPPPDSDADVRRALELAAGRMGLTWSEYRALADGNPELLQLERRVIADARIRWGVAPAPPVEVEGPEHEESEESHVAKLFSRIFVAVDYTMESHRALLAALELRRAHGSAICLFHSAESSGSDDWLGGIGSPAVGGDWVAEAKNRLRRFLANVAKDESADVEVRSCVGAPLHTLPKEAHAWGATLVVATAFMHTRILRSPAEKLLRALQLPMLIIPTDAGG